MKHFRKNLTLYLSISLSILIHLLLLAAFSFSTDTGMPAKKGGVISLSLNLENNLQQTKKQISKKRIIKHKKNSVVLKQYKNLKQKIHEEQVLTDNIYSGSQDTVIKVRNSYKGSVLKKIHEVKYYPTSAKKRRLEGTVKLKFTLNKNGSLKGKVVKIKESPHEILNKAGIKTIDMASPFPSFPKEIKDNEMTFLVDIDFRLT